MQAFARRHTSAVFPPVARQLPGSEPGNHAVTTSGAVVMTSHSDLCAPAPAFAPTSAALRLAPHVPSTPLRLPAFSVLLLAGLCFLACPVLAVQIPFENCMASSYPKDQLQWYPVHVEAVFDVTDPTYNLLVTAWGNVTGRVGDAVLPPPDSPEWSQNNSALDGKIVNSPDPAAGQARHVTTLYREVMSMTYQPMTDYANFCDSLLGPFECPLGPVFNKTPVDFPAGYPSFNLSHDFGAPYTFSAFNPTMIIWRGDEQSTPIGCVSATVTPTLGDSAWSLKFLPLFILLAVGFATIFAATLSPWGTTNLFHWTSNYGRDPDLLRLVTPGFGDCLQYLQFVVLTGGLNLAYPGFYQPVVSQASWSALIFDRNFVSSEPPYKSIVDGIYVANGTYGLDKVASLAGMADGNDIWAGMMIWLMVILGAVLGAVVLAYVTRLAMSLISNSADEDLRSKEIPFTIGCVIRVVFNFFLLPIVALSTFQLVLAGHQSPYTGPLVALATITIVAIAGFGAWMIYLVATIRPRSHLFDDLPTVLMYGPLYNTYSDEAAAFTIVPIILTVLRGIAIGGIQPSGVAQAVILAVCEVIQMLTLFSFRPFHTPTSMNAYHIGFAIVRFITSIMMVTFAPSIGLSEGQKGWVGYVILLLHACVMLLAFLLNALATIVEVIARLCGAGGDDVRGQTRGGLSKIFGARQLSRRVDRRGAQSRQSQISTAAMLSNDAASKRGYGRIRSESAGSMGILMTNQQRSSSVLDGRSVDAGTILTPTTPGENSTFSYPAPGQATRPQQSADPYYRPPRARHGTNEDMGTSPPRAGANQSLTSIDLGVRRGSQPADGDPDRSPPGPTSYAPVFAPRADYSTREVDFYYGVRGPALNSDGPGRRLGTGPADPTSPLTTATGWVKGLFSGKTKDKGKGFEVVRSARMPPAMRARGGEPAEDSPPEGIPVAMGVLRNGPIESDDEDDAPKTPPPRRSSQGSAGGDLLDAAGEPEGENERRSSESASERSSSEEEAPRVSKDPPLLPDLDAGESFRVPSRAPSKVSRQPSNRGVQELIDADVEAPEVPRKSSKRNSSGQRLSGAFAGLATHSEASGSQTHIGSEPHPSESTARLPFDRSGSQRRNSGSSFAVTEDFNRLPSMTISHASGEERPMSFGSVNQHNISRVDLDQDVDLLGASAEVVNDSRRPSPSSSRSARSGRS